FQAEDGIRDLTVTEFRRVLFRSFVTTEDGTGIVHTAPAFGADDYKVGKKYNIGIRTMVDREGKFVDCLGEFSNRFVKDYKNDKEIGRASCREREKKKGGVEA